MKNTKKLVSHETQVFQRETDSRPGTGCPRKCLCVFFVFQNKWSSNSRSDQKSSKTFSQVLAGRKNKNEWIQIFTCASVVSICTFVFKIYVLICVLNVSLFVFQTNWKYKFQVFKFSSWSSSGFEFSKLQIFMLKVFRFRLSILLSKFQFQGLARINRPGPERSWTDG